MRKLRIFLIELVLVAILVGWLLMRAPDKFDVFIPYVLAAIAWHLSFECFWQSDSIKAWRVRNGFSRGKTVGSALIGSCLICITFWFAGRQLVAKVGKKDITQNSQPGPAAAGGEPEPHLNAYLTITTPQKNSQPTLFVTNIGTVAIEAFQSAMDSGNGDEFDGVPSATELQPQGKMEVPFSPIFAKPTVLSFVLVYQVPHSTSGIKYHTRFKFYISGDQPFYPTLIEEGKGDLDFEKEMSQQLSRINDKNGTIQMVIPELKPDGRPNFVFWRSTNKLILINPTTRTASISCAYSTGNKVAEFSFEPTGDGTHVITVSWDDAKQNAILYIDGKGHTAKAVAAKPTTGATTNPPCNGSVNFIDPTNTDVGTAYKVGGIPPCSFTEKGGTNTRVNRLFDWQAGQKSPPTPSPTKPPE